MPFSSSAPALDSSTRRLMPAFCAAAFMFSDILRASATMSLSWNCGGVMARTASAPEKSSDAPSWTSPCTALKLGFDENCAGTLDRLR